jgi:hypothetical protein
MITDGSSAGHVDLSTEPAEEHSRRLRMNGPGGSPGVAQPREVSSGSIAKEAGMTTRDQLGDSWTVVLRRQPARMIEGRPEGGYTDAFEIICCDCGDHPDLDSEVSPELRRVRGPYPIADVIAAYMKHAGLHHQPTRATGLGPGRVLADRR